MNASEKTLATVERFNEMFNQHDVDAVMQLMTDDVVFENTSGGRFEGAANVRTLLQRAFELMTPGWFNTEDIFLADDRVVVLWAYRFNKAEPERGHIRGVDIFRVRNDKVAEKCSYVKSADFVQKLGLQLAGT